MSVSSNLSRRFLALLLAGLLVAQPALACTGIMLRAADGSVVHGRTLEFGMFIPTQVAVIPRGHSFTAKTPLGDGMRWNARYGVVGVMAFEDVAILDGLNEQGLAVGAFYLPTFAEYTPATPENRARALSMADFPNWLLTSFGTVAEVRAAIEANQAVIVPTILAGWPQEPQPFHYAVYDRTGAALVIEPVGGRLVLHDNPLGVLTNSPTFDWHMTNLRNYISLSPRNVSQIEVSGRAVQALGQGNGMLGLPGDFSPPSRFVRAAVFSATATPAANAAQGVDQVFHILNNFDIPVGVARSVEAGKVATDYTILTVARDPQAGRFFWKSYDDQTIRMVDLRSFNLTQPGVRRISTAGNQPVADMSAQLR